MKCSVKYPMMRIELVATVETLSDLDEQMNTWFPGTPGENNFGYAINFLFDDTNLDEDPDSYIGIVLLDISEAKAIKDLTDRIELLFKENGADLDCSEYVRTPEWEAVVEAAIDAKAIIDENNQKISN